MSIPNERQALVSLLNNRGRSQNMFTWRVFSSDNILKLNASLLCPSVQIALKRREPDKLLSFHCFLIDEQL